MTISNARFAISRARSAMIIDQPFFGALALRLDLVERPDIKTLAVDGKRMFYNPVFVESLDAVTLKSAVAHEVMHCVFDHCVRRGARQPVKWNVAGDYVINDVIKDAGFPLGRGWLHNPAYKGMTADHIYTLLPDNPDGGSDGGALDEIWDGSGEGESDPNAMGSQADRELMASEWKVAAMQAAAAAKQAGKLPGSLERFIDQMGKSKVDWRQQLRNLITEVSRNDYNWQRPNRHMVANGMYLPGLYSETFGVMTVVTDDSGSIDNPTLAAFTAEIDAIRASVQPSKTIHISCDAAVNHYQEFEQDDTFKLISKGGGGTDFRPPFAELEKRGEEPKALVYLTDGYGPFPETPPGYRVVWCMTTDVQPPWGECVRIEI